MAGFSAPIGNGSDRAEHIIASIAKVHAFNAPRGKRIFMEQLFSACTQPNDTVIQ
jgi:hypothetical protein